MWIIRFLYPDLTSHLHLEAAVANPSNAASGKSPPPVALTVSRKFCIST